MQITRADRKGVYTTYCSYTTHIRAHALRLSGHNAPGAKQAYDINDAQQITGWAFNNQTAIRSAVHLTPVSPPPPNQAPVAKFTYSCTATLARGQGLVRFDRGARLRLNHRCEQSSKRQPKLPLLPRTRPGADGFSTFRHPVFVARADYVAAVLDALTN